MRAAIFHRGEFTVGDFPLPPLQAGQIRVRPIANGICGTDLSAWAHTDDFLAAAAETNQELYRFDAQRPVVFGHEFTAEVTALGPGAEEFAVGQEVFVLPAVFDDAGALHGVGFSNRYPGGMSTDVIVMAAMHVPLDGVDPVLAATLEPVATGTNGARQSGLREGGAALVTGAGPVGLGAVVEFAAAGARTIVVSDPSAKRREIALAYGATVAVDPRENDPVEVWRGLAPAGGRLHVVEASGAPGLLTELLGTVPPYTVIAVVGGATGKESLRPIAAVMKNVSLVFASGPAHGEIRYEAVWRAYGHLREGRYDPALMVTGYTGLAGVQKAFDALRPRAGATEQVKILILPGLDTDELLTAEQAGYASAAAARG
ncbi:zinc-binding dehydrogenase [Streptomyces sp. WMMC500]|uniref:zinc-binding dehydrogenase n=1 Tax=Streptomyces sp. WMMC500 TaxID=3015154 RepID=UPI00248BC780|nr:zinc-binding dehydrogenase [Streptomyces sp. WMMC500]WBB61259.1 zinc-binding dehydrogenase [Streptomyces sp. WMMC500]